MSIPTFLSATQATHSNKDSSRMLSNVRMTAPLGSREIFYTPLLLDTQLDEEFQSNASSTHILRPAAHYFGPNGLGIRYPAPSYVKAEVVADRQVTPPAQLDGVFGGSSSGERSPDPGSTLQSNPIASEGDPFTEVYRLLNSIDAAFLYDPRSSSTLQYLDSHFEDSWPLSASTGSAWSQDEEKFEIAPTSSQSSLAGHSLSQDSHIVPSRSRSPAMVGPFPDINMFDMAYLNRAPEIGINPADIQRPSSVCVEMSSASPTSSLVHNSPLPTDLTSSEVLDSIITMLSHTVKKDNQTLQAAVLPTALRTKDDEDSVVHHSESRPMNPFVSRIGASEQKIDHGSPEELPFVYRFPTPTPASHRSPLVALPFQFNQQPVSRPNSDGNLLASQDSPVLNAHIGIDLGELVRRADNYRTLFPGRPIDKKWLMAYAGKLTKRGELLEDYRCYVNGCTQKNKRRDHIIVHVGSHVDQRLFGCNVWYTFKSYKIVHC